MRYSPPESHSARVVIGWSETPFYAARCIAHAIDKCATPIQVVSTGSQQDAEMRKAMASFPVQWIPADKKLRWADLGIDPPACFFETGWATPAFNSLAREVKSHGGKVVCLIDNTPRSDLRQALGAIYFRAKYRQFYDAVMVPGKSSARLMWKFGMPAKKVFTGLYGADRLVFNLPTESHERKREFLFVGQLIRRKGVELLLEAFENVRARHDDWMLRVVGAGPLREQIRGDGVIREQFLPANDLALRYRDARYFVLPSLDEHWGVVAHEAALCGMPLLLSDRVGAAVDLLDPTNGVLFRAGSVAALAETMEKAISIPSAAYSQMSRSSIAKAADFGPEAWTGSFEDILHSLQVA